MAERNWADPIRRRETILGAAAVLTAALVASAPLVASAGAEKGAKDARSAAPADGQQHASTTIEVSLPAVLAP